MYCWWTIWSNKGILCPIPWTGQYSFIENKLKVRNSNDCRDVSEKVICRERRMEIVHVATYSTTQVSRLPNFTIWVWKTTEEWQPHLLTSKKCLLSEPRNCRTLQQTAIQFARADAVARSIALHHSSFKNNYANSVLWCKRRLSCPLRILLGPGEYFLS